MVEVGPTITDGARALPSITAYPCDDLHGRIRVPGDKSISHRALMLGALAAGETEIGGLLEAEDVLATARIMGQLGAEVERGDDGLWRIRGRGLGGLVEPDDVLDMGNSGTGARLLMGLLAGHPIRAVVTGDASLRSRPMERAAAPLRLMGARIEAREGCRLPLTLTGSADPLPIRYESPVASAQVKSAVLLAGLNAAGETAVIEKAATRDHTERMLAHFGAEVTRAETEAGQEVRVTGQPELKPARIRVPADPSSAAFPTVAALLVPGAELLVEEVGLNPLRSGLYETLQEMGANIVQENPRELGGEPVADLRLRASSLTGVEVPAERAPRMIDEYPVLAMAAACAEGRSVMHGLGELRVKESDRLAAVAAGLAACGVEVEEGRDSLTVTGCGGRPPGGNPAPIPTHLDHRIAMSFLVLGLAAERPVTIDDGDPIRTSFPDFLPLLSGLGARLEEAAVP